MNKFYYTFRILLALFVFGVLVPSLISAKNNFLVFIGLTLLIHSLVSLFFYGKTLYATLNSGGKDK